MKHGIVTWFVMLAFLVAFASVASPQANGTSNPNSADNSTATYAPVTVDHRKLFEVMGSSGITASDRADKINRRLESLIARPEDLPPFNKRDLIEEGHETIITLDGDQILSVTDADAQDSLDTRDELALLWGGKMATAVADAKSARINPVKGAGILIRNSFSDLFVSILRWLPRLAGAITLCLVFWGLARLSRWGMKFINAHTHFDSNTRQLLGTLAYFGTWTVGGIAILSTLGLEGGSIATTLGISGFVLGFAFKDILSHLFAGLMLLLGRQFHVGDQIVVKEFEGTVERIELRALFLRTYDNRLVIIPNGDVFTSIVTSNTASSHRRREFVIGIGYTDDISKAQSVALDTVRKIDGVAEEPAPDVLVDELASSTVNLRVRFHTHSRRADYMKVGSECLRQIKEAFDREKISMPNATQSIVIENLDTLADRLKKIESGSDRVS